MKSEKMSWFERRKIASSLERYNLFFRTIHDLADIRMVEGDSKVKTAGVTFSKGGQLPLSLDINKEYWSELSDYEKQFLIAHQCAHVIFDHPKRFRSFLGDDKSEDLDKDELERRKKAWETGIDVAVNEMLARQFGFDRNKLKHPSLVNAPWLDTVWPEENVPSGKSSDYYIQKILDQTPQSMSGGSGKDKNQGSGKGEKGSGSGSSGGKKDKSEQEDEDDSEASAGGDQEEKDEEQEGEGNQQGPQSFDQHEQFLDGNDDDSEELDQYIGEKDAQEFLGELNKDQHTELGGQHRGIGDGSGSWRDILTPAPPKKRKWEKVIRHWVRQSMNEKLELFERWDSPSGRYSQISDGKLKIPFERWMVDDHREKNKVNLLFFLDTSGSCYQYGDRFFKAARTIPTDRFNLHLAFFDDIVVPTSLKEGKVRCGGGTSFDILEKYAQSLPQYPDAVFVISDGYGNHFKCAHPRKWIWFLTPQNTTSCIPNGSRIYKLEDYE